MYVHKNVKKTCQVKVSYEKGQVRASYESVK